MDLIEVTIGGSTLYCADSNIFIPPIPAGTAIVTDPPYVFDTSGGGRFRKARPSMDNIAAEGLDKGFDHSIINPLVFDSCVVFCHNDQLHELLPYLKGSYDRQALCIWQKPNPMPVANKHYQPDMEIYIHAWNKGAHPVGDLADKKRITIAKPPRQKEFDHPTVKPATLMQKILTNVNASTIFDPFMGTGSTGVAAIQSGRTFIGIERNEKHFETAVRRIEAARDRLL